MESGAEGSRTLDLCSAIAALSQLSYRPRYRHCAERPRPGKGSLPGRAGFAIEDTGDRAGVRYRRYRATRRLPSFSTHENGRSTSTGLVEIFSPRMFSKIVP